jgi:hypothetical protein
MWAHERPEAHFTSHRLLLEHTCLTKIGYMIISTIRVEREIEIEIEIVVEVNGHGVLEIAGGRI